MAAKNGILAVSDEMPEVADTLTVPDRMKLYANVYTKSSSRHKFINSFSGDSATYRQLVIAVQPDPLKNNSC